MHWDLKGLKTLVQIPTLFIFSITAHMLSGGKIVASDSLIAEIVFITIFAAMCYKIDLEGPTLALFVTFIQSTSHFVLGENTHASELAMTIGHLVSGLFSYFTISGFSKAWRAIASFLKRLFIPNLFGFKVSELAFTARSNFAQHHKALFQFLASLKYRGPPLGLEFVNAA